MRFKLLSAGVFALLLFARCGTGMPEEVEMAYEELPEEIDFNFHVRPILSDRCFNCHGPDENSRKANLRLDVEEAVFSKIPRKETFSVVKGKPNESELILRILSEDSEIIMPTPESNLNLTAEEKAILLKWVEQGAEWKSHWAFTPPEKAELPAVRNTAWPKNEIDYFVLDKLDAMDMAPSEEAKKETLIRRLSFDLTGLPPTPEQITAFKNDTSEDAYEKQIDRLLASERFGERWAWEWLDVARYADTNGFQGDVTRDMWPWRDWVIQAFNDNMPYDEFTIKQLAGDLLPNATRDDILATAFNRNHPYNTEGGTIPEETRVTNVFDRVETTGTTWLGLTFNCARCHDHKYDAITQKEYYQMFDYYNQTSEEGGAFSGKVKPVLNLAPLEKQQEMAQVQQYVEQLEAEVDSFELKKFPRERGLPPSESEVANNLKGLDPRIYLNPASGRGAGSFKVLSEYFENRDAEYGELLTRTFTQKRKYDEMAASSTMVMVMDKLEEPRSTYVLERGGYNKPRLEETICSDVPAVLPALPALPDEIVREDLSSDTVQENTMNREVTENPSENSVQQTLSFNTAQKSPQSKNVPKSLSDNIVRKRLPNHSGQNGITNYKNNDRLALAQWMVSKEQPLTARVTVNRYWQTFFGNGIVKTIEDFGVQGALPTHPELLDWLAVDFQENGWDLKRLFKKIVMSATYRQTSKVSEELLQKDPENRYLARATRMRLPSWMLRDQALLVSGLLVDSIGGQPVKPYQPEGIWSEATFGRTVYEQDTGDALYRRSLYTFWRRIVGPTFLFDNASRQVCEVKNLHTNTPLHALTTLNDVTYMEASRVFAEDVLMKKQGDGNRLTYAFERIVSRKPKPGELSILQNRLEQLRFDFEENPNEARELVSIGEYPKNMALDLTDHAAYTVLGSLLLNLDETITRQ